MISSSKSILKARNRVPIESMTPSPLFNRNHPVGWLDLVSAGEYYLDWWSRGERS
jgi:hypothetical protein